MTIAFFFFLFYLFTCTETQLETACQADFFVLQNDEFPL